MMPSATVHLFLALRKKDTLLRYLASRKCSFKVYPEDSQEFPGGVQFLVGDEFWLADFLPNGSFRQLVWA